MSFNAAFLIAESSTLGAVTLSDTSVGSDPNLTGRTISIYRSDGTNYVTDIVWPIAQSYITLQIIDKDVALNFIVNWASSSPLPSPSTYTANKLFVYTAYGENFYYSLTQLQTSHPIRMDDKDYYYNKMALRVEMDSALQAITVGNDIYASQSAVERYNYLIANQDNFF